MKEVEETFINKTDTLVFITVNGETIKTTEGHSFYVEDIGWLPAGMLQEGDILSLEDGREIPIQNVKIVEYNYYISVYNFEVDDYHTYYISVDSVLVHNMCAKKRKVVRVRHYTNRKGLNGIKETGTIKASDNNRVYMENARKKPKSQKDAEKFYQIKDGKGRDYVEFDIFEDQIELVQNPRYGRIEMTVRGDIEVKNGKFVKRK